MKRKRLHYDALAYPPEDGSQLWATLCGFKTTYRCAPEWIEVTHDVTGAPIYAALGWVDADDWCPPPPDPRDVPTDLFDGDDRVD